MAKYCRYCEHAGISCHSRSVLHCGLKDKYYSKSTASSPTKCESYSERPAEDITKDCFYERMFKGERTPKKKDCEEQMGLFEN